MPTLAKLCELLRFTHTHTHTHTPPPPLHSLLQQISMPLSGGEPQFAACSHGSPYYQAPGWQSFQKPMQCNSEARHFGQIPHHIALVNLDPAGLLETQGLSCVQLKPSLF